MGNKLIIIEVDALLGTHNALSHPHCMREVCDKGFNFRGKDGRCTLGKWCVNAHYRPEDISKYRSESNITANNCYMAVLPALDKLANAGWSISLWTTRPRRQTFRIISVLRRAGIWERAQMICGTPLLLNNSELPEDGKFSPATEKLTLYEKIYGKRNDSDCPLVAIESNPLEASILQAYGGWSIVVHLSPKIWLDIIVVCEEDLDEMLTQSNSRKQIPAPVDQAS